MQFLIRLRLSNVYILQIQLRTEEAASVWKKCFLPANYKQIIDFLKVMEYIATVNAIPVLIRIWEWTLENNENQEFRPKLD